jgi:hypothetical protein
MTRCVEVLLAIPDNEALTALATLQRLAIPVAGVERGDLYRCDLDGGEAGPLVETLRGLETVFNPNKHVLRVREGDGPGPGEVWIDEIGVDRNGPNDSPVRIAGRTLPGVRRLERFTAWRLFARPHEPAGPDIVRAATETLLCNPAFQKAITS